MKRSFILTIFCLLWLNLIAQVPQAFKYQAVARDASGSVLANRSISFRISILGGSVTGTIVYSETHMAKTTNAFGLVDLEIGKGTPGTGTFNSINWNSGTYFIKVEMDPAGRTAFQEMGISQLLSVPYALYANEVTNKDDADADPTNEIQILGLNGSQLSLSKGGGTVTLPSSTAPDNWGTQFVISDATLAGQGTTASPLRIAQQIATNGQVLKWNGSSWSPGNDNTGSSVLTLPYAGSVASINAALNISNSGDGIGILGQHTSSTGSGNGVEGDTKSTQGYGIAGYATAASGYTCGVYGNSASESGIGVYGAGSSSFGGTGVYGKSYSTSGVGVYGEAEKFGIAGSSSKDQGIAVAGRAEGTNSIGVYGKALANGSTGVYAEGYIQGVYGEAMKTGGTGLWGKGEKYGVRGFGSNSGVYGSSDNWGVHGESTNCGVFGYAYKYGVYGVSTDEQGRGITGEAKAANSYGVYSVANGSGSIGVYGDGEKWGVYGIGNEKGIYGYSMNGNGIYGFSLNDKGVSGDGKIYGVSGTSANCGVYANGGNYGMFGEGPVGIKGLSKSSTGSGVWGEAANVEGIGVRGISFGQQGIGVVGQGEAYDFLAVGSGVNYGSQSSIRWKKNIVPIPDPLVKVLALRGVYFNWDETHRGKHDIGMIAEEVGKVLPEIVIYEDNGIDASGMDYSKLTPLLVEAIKELKTENDNLKSQNGEQQSRIEGLESRLSKLESLLQATSNK
jgi:hypothetical protein